MSELKTESAKKRLMRRVRKQRLKYITILPSLITLLNGIFGFAAIIATSRALFALAGYMILMAMIADMLDGRLARMSQNTSSFGGQLDSLCDIISFGVAPAFLMLKVLESELSPEWISFSDDSFIQRFIWVTAAAYICCAAIRLARFNVENEEDESAHMSFMGLPTPAAAGVIVSLVIFHQETLPTFAIICALPFFALGISILMVSRIRYPHIFNQYLRGKKPFTYLIRVLLLLLALVFFIQTALVVIFCGFVANSFLRWLYLRVSATRFFARLKHKINPDKNNLVPAAQHSASIAIDEAKVDE